MNSHPLLPGPLGALAVTQSGRSMRATSTFREGADGNYDPNAPPKSDLEEKSNRDNFRVQPGQTHVLLDAAGPGVITHMWITFLGPEPHPWAKDGSANHQEMLLRIYYDGREKPGVEAPLGDFFGGCFGKRSEVISLPVVAQGGDSYNCFWHMPFRHSIRIEIVNESDKPISLLYYNIDWIKKDELPSDTPYFYAQYRQEYPLGNDEDGRGESKSNMGRPYLLLDTKGKGHYVGTVFCVRTRGPGWFGEGDEMIAIDGEEIPSVWGTGTEDYFLCAWGLETTSTPYFGVPYFDQWGIVGGHTSAYRWHINDPILFNESIRVEFETFGWNSPDENPDYRAMSWNPREDDYASVAFWYQTGIPTFEARAPHAKYRKLPSIDREIFLARDSELGRAALKPGGDLPRIEVTGRADRDIAEIEIQELWEHFDYPVLAIPGSGGRGQFSPGRGQGAGLAGYGQASKGPVIEIPITVKEKEPLRLLINAAVRPDSGMFQAYLDDVKLREPMDFYSPKIEQREFHLLDFWPEPGKYVLRLECVGKNHLSSSQGLTIESARLRFRRPRVKAWAHDADKDWRKEPLLYE
ncbi:MAG TPA: glycoside hydrolase family 172 protein [Fimbriimonadaceae bacterium]|nr:glycoside hydrolase family 172 protein [Fimbriimonadaceae bacterium]